MLKLGELGIHPPGALGVAFFVHARAESFIGRIGDGISMTLRKRGMLHLFEEGRDRFISLKDRVSANFLEAEALDRLPELVLICCNPIQLKLITGELVSFLENLAERGTSKVSTMFTTACPSSSSCPTALSPNAPSRNMPSSFVNPFFLSACPASPTKW